MSTLAFAHPKGRAPLLPATEITSSYNVGSDADYDAFSKSVLEEAKIVVLTEVSDDKQKKILMNGMFSIQDASSVVLQAFESYQNKSKPKCLKWLKSLSTRLHHYGTVMDVLVNQHPEYVSLAWGAFKIVFMAVVQHEEIVIELARALSKIADVLPRANLAMRLYRTPRMRVAAVRLWSNVLQLFSKALKWLNQGKISHAIGAVLKPWSLNFADTLKDCEAQAITLQSEAETAMQAEIRDMHILLQATQSQLVQTESILVKALAEQQTFNKVIHNDMLHQRAWTAKNLLPTITALSCFIRLPEADGCWNYCVSLRQRSRRAFGYVKPQGVLDLEKWSSDPRSSILVATDASDHIIRNFMIEVVELIQKSPHPVIWILPYHRYWDSEHFLVDIVSAMVLQAIQLNPEQLVSRSNAITASDLNGASNLVDWLRILHRVLADLQQVFIIIDAELLSYASGYDRQESTTMLQKLFSVVKSTKVKVLVSGKSINVFHMSRYWDASQWSRVKVRGEIAQGLRTSVGQQARRQADYRRLVRSRNKKK